MVDPLTEVVTLLQPAAAYSKLVSGAGRWRVRRTEPGKLFYCVVLEGSARLEPEADASLILHANDFVLIPAARHFSLACLDPPEDNVETLPSRLPDGEFRLGAPDAAPNIRMIVGYCQFASPDAAMLVSLLPRQVHVRNEARMTTLVRLIDEETRTQRQARELVLARLLEVLLIEAFRSGADAHGTPGLARGMADARLAVALRRIHESPAQAWTVAGLADEASLSRSSFFERFQRALGMTPMEYLLSWRMALAKRLLRAGSVGVATVAERVGYSSASTFSVAFARHVGLTPAQFARQQRQASAH